MLRIIATDNGDGGTPATDTIDVTMVVLNENRAPVVPDIANQFVDRGETKTLLVSATDADGNSLTITATGLPSFVSLTDHHDGTATLTIAPGLNEPRRDYTITITATDDGDLDGPGNKRSASDSFILHVNSSNDAPQFEPIGNKVAVVGQELVITLRATDEDANDLLTFDTPDGRPAGATLESTGNRLATFRWTPSEADIGTRTIRFRVRDNASTPASAEQTITIRVGASNDAPILAPITNRQVAEGSSLQIQMQATDADLDPLTYSVSNIAQLAGATFDPVTRIFRWTPGFTDTGVYTGIVFTVSDGSASASETISITVTNTNRAPVIDPVSPKSGREGGTIQFSITATDQTDPVGTITFSASNLPPGAQFEPATGLFYWTPSFEQAGDYSVHFTATDGGGASSTINVPIHIDATNRAPTLSVSSHSVKLGSTLSFELIGRDLDQGVLKYSMSQLEGATLDPDTGVFTWTPGPGQAGDHAVLFKVSDGKSEAIRSVIIRAAATLPPPQVLIELTPSFAVAPGTSVIVHPTATSLADITSITLKVNNQPVALDGLGRALLIAGSSRITIEVIAVDADGLEGRATTFIQIKNGVDNTPPVISFDPGLNGSKLTAPKAIIANVADANLASWRLEIAEFGNDQFTLLQSGMNTASAQQIALVDPSKLADGFYRLRLTASDVSGLTSSTEAQIEVLSDDKTHYSQSNNDLDVTLNGVTLDLVRSYDSLNIRHAGSFGNGWRLGIRDARLQTNVPLTGRENVQVFTPFRIGTRLQLTLPSGQRAGFTFTPLKQTAGGVTYYTPAWTADSGLSGYILKSVDIKLTLTGSQLYDSRTGRAYNPAASEFGLPQYELTVPDGTKYHIHGRDGVTALITPAGKKLVFSDSGITASNGQAVQFTRDAGGRIKSIAAPDRGTVVYRYNADGDLVLVRNLSSAAGTFLGYSSDTPHLLTVVAPSANGGGSVISYQLAPQSFALTANLGVASQYAKTSVTHTLASGQTHRFAFNVRASELNNTPHETIYLGVIVDPVNGSTLSPAIPTIPGLIATDSRTIGGRSFALFALTREGLHSLEVNGSNGTSGTYALSLFIAGDVNRDAIVDGDDATDLAALRASSNYSLEADANQDGVLNSADAQLLGANTGYAANVAPNVYAGTADTHQGLDVVTSLPSLAGDPNHDDVFFRIVGTSHGTATLVNGGTSVLFRPDAGFAGDASFTFVADDGYTTSAQASVSIDVSNAALLKLSVSNRPGKLNVGGQTTLQVLGDFADQTGVTLPASYLTFQSLNPSIVSVDSTGRITATGRGTGIVSASRGGVRVVMAVQVGELFTRQQELLEAQGLAALPGQLFLNQTGAVQQLHIVSGTGELELTAASTGTRYFSSNEGVAQVDASGRVTATGLGVATITAINGPAELSIDVRVQPAAVTSTTIGAQGGQVGTTDGTILSLPAGALAQNTSVSISPLTQNQLPIPVVIPFEFVGAFQLNVGSGLLGAGGQIAIPTTGLVQGSPIVVYRAGTTAAPDGSTRPAWFQVATATVGPDGFARTGNEVLDSGILESGQYLIVYAPPESTGRVRFTFNLANSVAKTTTGFHLGIEETVTAITSGLQTSAQQLAGVTVELAHQITGTGIVTTLEFSLYLPAAANRKYIMKEVGLTGTFQAAVGNILVSANNVARFEQELVNQVLPQGHPSDPPVPQSIDVEYFFINGNLRPVVKLVGDRFEFGGVHGDVMFVAPGMDPILQTGANVLYSREGNKDVLRAVIPQKVAIGLTEIHVSRRRPVSLGGGPDVSIAMRPTVSGEYVFGVLPLEQKVVVIDQATRALVAQIPVPGLPENAVVTPDGTRVYVPLASGSVAVIDALALQLIDANPSTPAIDTISLGPAAVPFRATVDPQGMFVYVSDERVGSIYQIDIHPDDSLAWSGAYNRMVAKINVGIAPAGLRGLAVNASSERLFVAAPSRINFGAAPSTGEEFIHIIDVNPAHVGTRPADPDTYLKVIKSLDPGPSFDDEPYGVEPAADPNTMLFTNRRSDEQGIGYISGANGPVQLISISHTPFQLRPPPGYSNSGVFDRTLNDSFDVNNAQAIAMLPANTRSQTNPGHDTYLFVSAFNLYNAASPDHNPDHEGRSKAVPAGGNVAIVRLSSNGARVVAATRPLPYEFADNLVLSEDGRYLYAAYRGQQDFVCVYDVDAIIREVEFHETRYTTNTVDPHINLINLPINNQRLGAEVANYDVDVNADYRLDVPFRLNPPNASPLEFKVYDPTRAPINVGDQVRGLDGQVTPRTPLTIQSSERIRIATHIDQVNVKACPEPGVLVFTLSKQARVTLRILGEVARDVGNPLDGNTTTLTRLENLDLPAGTFEVRLVPAGQLHLPGNYSYTIEARSTDGQTAQDQGIIEHEMDTDISFPIGHTIVKGVDIWDGHVTHSTQDVMIPGRGLSLDFTRTYSSSGDFSGGSLGAGWTHSYDARLVLQSCGDFTVVGGEGSGNTFAASSAHTVSAQEAARYGVPANAIFYYPQIGYHSTLVQPNPADPTIFDFFTKGHIRYRFQLLPGRYPANRNYALRFIEDPNGNRISLYYDKTDPGAASLPDGLKARFDLDPSTLDVIKDASGRALVLQYQRIALDQRIIHVGGYGVGGIDITYHYDEGLALSALAEGNLTSVVRKGSAASDTRIQKYTYTKGIGISVGSNPNTGLFELAAGAIGGHNLRFYTDPNGNTTEYKYYELGGGPVLSTLGIATSFDVSPYEFVRRIIEEETDDHAAPITQFGYDMLAGKRNVDDALGRRTTYTINPYGATTRIEEPMGRVTFQEWATPDTPHTESVPGYPGRPGIDAVLVSRTDSLGRRTEYKYDRLGNVIEEKVLLTTIDRSLSRASNIRRTVDSEGHEFDELITSYTYDPLFSRMVRKIDPEGKITYFVIDSQAYPIPLPAGAPAPTGNTGNLLATVDALGKITRYQYLPNGDLQTVFDPLDNATQYSDYDAYGNPWTITDAEGNVTNQVFDKRSRLLSTHDTFGHHVTYAYDNLDRVIQQDKIDGTTAGLATETIHYSYLPGGEIARITDGLGQITEMYYDELNRLVRTVELDPNLDGNRSDDLETLFTYDPLGNLTSQQDARHIITEYRYDHLSRRFETRITGGPSSFRGVTLKVGYDLEGNVTFQEDLNGDRTDSYYDELYRLIRTELPFTNTFADVRNGTGRAYTTSRYDKVGNVVRQTDANGYISTSTYDDAYRLRIATDALGNTVEYAYDDNGNVIRETHKSGTVETSIKHFEDIDGLNRPQRIREEVWLGDPSDGATPKVVYTTLFEYDDKLNTVITTNPRGIRNKQVLDGLDRVYQVIVDLGGFNLTTTNRYDANGNLVAVRDPQDGDAPDPNLGHEDVRTTYDGLNRPIRAEYQLGIDEFWSYDGDGNVTGHIDKRDIVFENTYDNLNRPLEQKVVESISNPGKTLKLSSTSYDDLNHKFTTSDANKNKTVTEFDGLDRPVQVTDALGHFTTSIYDGANLRATIDRNHQLKKFTYDALNRPTLTEEFSASDHVNPQTTFSTRYEDSHKRVIDTDRNDVETIRQLDSRGRTIQTSRRHAALAGPYGTAEVVMEVCQYDENDNKVLYIDAAQNQTSYEFDGADRMFRMKEGVGSTIVAATTTIYDNVGNVLSVKDGRGTGLFDARYTYDARYRKFTEENAEGEITTYEYNANDNVTRIIEPLGQDYDTRFTYDELGQLLSVDSRRGSGDAAVGGVTFYRYDANRNKIAQQDANGNLVTYEYDALNRLKDTFQHFAPGAITASTIRTDSFGGELSSALLWHSEYDNNGNLKLTRDPMNQEATTTYDHLDRLKTVTFSNHHADLAFQVQSITYFYDGNGNVIDRDEVKRIGGANVTQHYHFDYDKLDRLTRSENYDHKVIRYEYDKQGNRKKVIDSDNIESTYTYDARNRLLTATTEGGTTTYDYYEDSLIRSVTYPNGTIADYNLPDSYDKADRLTHVVHHTAGGSLIASFRYVYDDNGNRHDQFESHAGIKNGAELRTIYTYDLLNRLRHVTQGHAGEDGDASYFYDNVGNRIEERGTDLSDPSKLVNRKFHYDRLNRLRAIENLADPSRGVAYDYDDNGNRISKTVGNVTAVTDGGGNPITLIINPVETTEYEFGIRNEMLATQALTGGQVTFDYDAAGMRVRKASPTGETRYLYDGRSTLLEYGQDGKTTVKYDYGYELLNLVDVTSTGRDVQFYHYDALGSTAALTDSTGALQKAYVYDAFGDLRERDRSGNALTAGTSVNPKQYTGHYHDDETDLHYFGARYYDDEIGGFISQDSYLGEMNTPPSLHRYLYAHANPTRFVDPSGHAATLIGAAAGFFWGFGQMTGQMINDLGNAPKHDGWDYVSIWGQNIIGGAELGLSFDAAKIPGLGGAALSGALGGAGFNALTFAGEAESWSDFAGEQLSGAAAGAVFGAVVSKAAPAVASIAGPIGLSIAEKVPAPVANLASKAVDKGAALAKEALEHVPSKLKTFLPSKFDKRLLEMPNPFAKLIPAEAPPPVISAQQILTSEVVQESGAAPGGTAVPWLTGTKSKELVDAAKQVLQEAESLSQLEKGNLAASLFKQISDRTKGAWRASVGVGEQGETVFAGDFAAIVIDKASRVFSGKRDETVTKAGVEFMRDTIVPKWKVAEGLTPRLDWGSAVRPYLTNLAAAPQSMKNLSPLGGILGGLIYSAFTTDVCSVEEPKKPSPQASGPVILNQLSSVLAPNSPLMGVDVGSDELPGMTSAVANWAAVLPSIGPIQVTLVIENLPGSQIGETRVKRFGSYGLPAAGTIVFDRDAAGVGWYVDATPQDAAEFGQQIDGFARHAGTTSAAANKYDLYTVMLHEIGHLLGFDGSNGRPGQLSLVDTPQARAATEDLMNEMLSPGVRRLPSNIDLEFIRAFRTQRNFSVPLLPESPTGSEGTGGNPTNPAPPTTPTPPGTGTTNPTGGSTQLQPQTTVANGNFANGDVGGSGFAWTPRGDISVDAGEGVLGEGGTQFASLSQNLVVPQGAKTLRFTLVNAHLLANATGAPDAFEVALLNPTNNQPLQGLPTLSGTLTNSDALLNLQTGGRALFSPLVSIPGLNSGGTFDFSQPVIVSIDVSHLEAGTPVKLYFDLLGFGQDASEVRIDNVAFSAAGINGRFVFYNNSAFDGNDPDPGESDNAAIATDKVALLPGQTATFANYTSYAKGINGVMIDLAGAHGELSTADFVFKVGNSIDVSSWTTAPAPLSISVRPGAGVNGADRVTIIWADEAIAGQWLQVTMLGGPANPNTGLAANEVFYFGNAIGESGNSGLDARVNSTDEAAARNNPQSSVAVTALYDYNRDGAVNAADEAVARAHATGLFSSLKLIATPMPVAGAPATFVMSGQTVSILTTTSLGARFDVRDNRLIIRDGQVGGWNGSAYTGVTGLIQSGRNGGQWNGAGIITSMPSAVGPHAGMALAVASNADLGKTTFGGQSVTSSDVLVMFTYAGDANLDGKLNIDDYVRIDQGIASGLKGWTNGDFNYDGKINIDDYVIIDGNVGWAFGAGSLGMEAAGQSAFSSIAIPDSEPREIKANDAADLLGITDSKSQGTTG